MIQSLWYLDRLLYHAPKGLQYVIRELRETPSRIYGLDKATSKWCLGVLLNPGTLGNEDPPTDTDALVRFRFTLGAQAVMTRGKEYWQFDCLWNLYHDDVSYLVQAPDNAQVSRVPEDSWLISFEAVHARADRVSGDLSRVEALLKALSQTEEQTEKEPQDES